MRILMLLLAVAFLITGCGDRPPSPKLRIGNDNVPFEAGSYSWRTFNKSVISDSPAPSQLVEGKEPFKAAPGATLSVSFGSKPRSIVVTEWSGMSQVQSTEINNGTFKLPDTAGTYIYSIRAEWGSGSGTYAFVVELK